MRNEPYRLDVRCKDTEKTAATIKSNHGTVEDNRDGVVADERILQAALPSERDAMKCREELLAQGCRVGYGPAAAYKEVY